jgi:ParB family chromosome partitioning protein
MTDTTTTVDNSHGSDDNPDPQPVLGTLEHLNPNGLVLDTNVRDDAAVDTDFLASVKEHGVLTPIAAMRENDGTVRVRAGQRRTVAARQAGLNTVPVYVRPASGGDEKAQVVERVAEQIVENDKRRALSDAQRARGIQQMIDSGLSVAKVAKKLAVGKDMVKAAETAAKSGAALEALEGGQISLTEAAVLTEFEQDGAEAVARLVTAAGTPQFDHLVAQLRSERASAHALAEATAHYTERGFTIVDDDDRWGWKLDRVPLRHLQRAGDDDGAEGVDDTVIGDPQHWAVRLEEYVQYVDSDGNVVNEGEIDWDTEGVPDAEPEEGLCHADSVTERPVFEPEWYCLNPEAAGLQVTENYQRNAEWHTRDRSGESHTVTTDLDSDASEPTERPRACAPKPNRPRPKSGNGESW